MSSSSLYVQPYKNMESAKILNIHPNCWQLVQLVVSLDLIIVNRIDGLEIH